MRQLKKQTELITNRLLAMKYFRRTQKMTLRLKKNKKYKKKIERKSMRLPGVRRCISNNYAVIIQEIVD